eukprot:3529519-Pleurochrysis_carterae.AAC.4
MPLRATTVSRWSRLFFATEPYRDLGAGAIAAALTTPLDVLVTHTMTDSNAPAERKGLPVGAAHRAHCRAPFTCALDSSHGSQLPYASSHAICIFFRRPSTAAAVRRI